MKKCAKLQSFPDLSALVELETLSLPYALDAQYHDMGRDWMTTRLVVVMMRRKYHYGGARAAALTVMLVARQSAMGRDVARLLGQAVYATRRCGSWARADKVAYDVERYHCVQPVPWVTLFGPSVLACACGFSFVGAAEPLPAVDDVAGIQRIQRRRAEHFQRCYNADAKGYCRLESRHLPLHRCVQQVLSRVRHRGEAPDEGRVKAEVLALLRERTDNKVVLTPPRYGAASRDRRRGVHTVFAAEIEEDLMQCVREYVALRRQGALEPRGTGWFGWFVKKYRQEVNARVYE